MKARYVFLLAVCSAFLSQSGWAQSVFLPLRAGQFSATTTGSFAICLNPTTFAEEACSTAGAKAFPLIVLSVGNGTGDAKGNVCESIVETDSDFPVDASAPFVAPNEHVVAKVTFYNPFTGSGNDSFKGYIGGKCNGASFDSTGATLVSFGTGHFTVSENGNRIDGLATKLQNPTNSIGDFSLYTVDRALVTSNP